MDPKEKDPFTDNALEGRYANYFRVGHNAFEFIFDFGQYNPEKDQAELYSRVITSPAYAKVFLGILAKSLENYEIEYEIIEEE